MARPGFFLPKILKSNAHQGEQPILSCADPKTLESLHWLACYLTTGKHMAFYSSFGTVLLLLAVTAPAALAFGFGGAMAARGVRVVMRRPAGVVDAPRVQQPSLFDFNPAPSAVVLREQP